MSSQLRFKRAETPEEQAAAFRLRYLVFCEEQGYLDESKYPDGLEIDEWDARSEHFIAYRDDVVAATVRLIFDSDIGFQTENYANESLLQNRDICEISRLTLCKSLRGKSSEILVGLAHAMFDYCIDREVTKWFSTMFLPTWTLFFRQGLYFRIVGGMSVWPMGSCNPVVPVYMDWADAQFVLAHKNQMLYEQIVGTTPPPPRNSGGHLQVLLDQAARDYEFVRSALRPVESR